MGKKSKKNKQFKLKEFPANLEIGHSVFSFEEFKIKKIPNNLALKFYGNGDVIIYINGEKVLEKYLRTKRHYDDINLSNHINKLKKGLNKIAIEINNPTENGQFDYGLYIF